MLVIVAILALTASVYAMPRPAPVTVDADQLKLVDQLQEAINGTKEAYYGFVEGFKEDTGSDPELDVVFDTFTPFVGLPTETIKNLDVHLTEWGQRMRERVLAGGKAPSVDEAVEEYRKIVNADVDNGLNKFSEALQTDSFFASLKNARDTLVRVARDVIASVIDVITFIFRSTLEHPDEWKEFDKIAVDDKSDDLTGLPKKLKEMIANNELSDGAKVRAKDIIDQLNNFQKIVPKKVDALSEVFRDVVMKKIEEQTVA